MGSCAMHRPWEAVQCVCKHGAGDHAIEDANVGCTEAVDGELPCNCQLSREEVLFAGTQRAIAEVCEHNDKRRDGRREFTGR